MTPERPGPAIGALRLPRRIALAAGAPEFLVAGMVALALAAGVTVSIGQHRPWTTLPLAVVLWIGLWLLVRPRTSPGAADARAGLIACGTAALWAVVGVCFSSEYLVVSRDPGFLALSGVWLTNHPSTDIPTLGTIAAAEGDPTLMADAWQAWNLEGTVIQPQGAKMLPAVLAVGGWFGGVTGVLWANVVIGAAAMLAIYVLARRVLGPMTALLPMVMLGLSVPHLALSRSPYSEPLTLVLIIAGAAWAWRGLEQSRIGLVAVGGLVTGATMLVRIDGGIYALGVLAGVIVAAVAIGRDAARSIAVFLVCQAVAVAAGYASLQRWSAAYIGRLDSESSTLRIGYIVAAALTLVGAGVLWLARARVEELRKGLAARRGPIASVAAWSTAGIAVIFALRPLFFTDHRGTESGSDQFTNKVVAAFQESAGYGVDGSRTYAEHTATWLAIHFTWVIMALAVIGLGRLVWLAGTSRPGIAVPLLTAAVPTLVYFVRPAIMPDQVWAIRRFEPATIPVLVLCATVGAMWLAPWLASRLWGMRGPGAGRTTAGIVLIASMLLTYVSVRVDDKDVVQGASLVVVRERLGARAELSQLCDVIDGRPTILSGSSAYFGSIRVMCDVPVVLDVDHTDTEALLRIRDIMGEDTVLVTRNEDWYWQGSPTPLFITRIYRSPYALQYMPRTQSYDDSEWYAALIAEDGSLIPLGADGLPSSDTSYVPLEGGA